jgi:hypothetical protein
MGDLQQRLLDMSFCIGLLPGRFTARACSAERRTLPAKAAS